MREQIKSSLFSSFTNCLLFADVCDLMWFTLDFSFLLSWVSCQLELALTRLRLVRSCTQTHSANCRLVLYTPDQNHREDDCGFNGQRKQRGPQKQTQTLRHFNKYTKSPPWSRMNRFPHLGFKSRLVSLNKCFIQTFVYEMAENPKWRPWLRFQRDMTIQRRNYMCCNALLIILAMRHAECL